MDFKTKLRKYLIDRHLLVMLPSFDRYMQISDIMLYDVYSLYIYIYI